MRKIIGILLMIGMVGIFGCTDRKAAASSVDLKNRSVAERVKRLKVPDNSSGFKTFMAEYLTTWHDITITNEGLKKKIERYMNGTNYQVVWGWDTDGDDVTDYLAVKFFPGIYKGVTQGILIDELGNVKMYIDTDKGLYTPDYMIVDFKAFGFRAGEVGCIRLLFNPYAVRCSKKDMDDLKIRYPKRSKYYVQTGGFMYQLIDPETNIIQDCLLARFKYAYDMIEIDYEGSSQGIIYQPFTMETQKEELERQQQLVRAYRKNKEQGLVLKAFNENPDDVK